MRIFTLAAVAAAFLLPVSVHAADEILAQERYEEVREQARHSGSVGFDKRHKAYRDYVLEARRDDASSMADIAPAAGGESSEQDTGSQENNGLNQ